MILPLWSFVAAHGVLELPAIFIAAGAGFGLARGLLFPGTLPRKESLARAGARSVRLVVGVIPMLVVAGTIEGFVSPSNLHFTVKFLLAAALGVLFVMYVARGGSKALGESASQEVVVATPNVTPTS